jgi:transposase
VDVSHDKWSGDPVCQRLERFRAIATRYDKTALSYQAMINLATLTLWL